MTLHFQDRISGRRIDSLSAAVLSGQYRCADSDLAHDFVLLIDDVQLINLPDGTSCRVEFLTGAWPPKDEQSSLRHIGEAVTKALNVDGDWNTLLFVSPIVMRELVELQDFERFLDKHMSHLQEVCRNPITYLHSEEMRLPVGRVRRVSPRSIQHLAAHTEDWNQKTVTSVNPNRVIAVVSEDLYDFYENRVAIRLIHELRRYLSTRIHAVEQITQGRSELENIRAGAHHRNKRVYTLWAEVFDVEGERTVQSTLETLERLHRNVSVLLDSPLSKAMPRSATRVDPTVRDTNIFVNDEHYRYVAILWRKLMQTELMRPRSYAEKYREAQQTVRGFDQYCLLLIVRGLEQLGYKPISPNLPGIGETTRWQRYGGEVTLMINLDGTFVVELSDGRYHIEDTSYRLHIVPLMNALTDGSLRQAEVRDLHNNTTASIRKKALTSGRHKIETPQETTLVLYPPGRTDDPAFVPDELRHELFTIGNDLQPPASWGFLPVSSYAIDAVERVARALQWVLLGSQIAAYPPRIQSLTTNIKNMRISSGWLELADQRTAKVLRLRTKEEEDRFKVELDDAKGRLRSQGKAGLQEIEQLRRFEKELDSSWEQIQQLLVCPICDTTTSVRSFHPQEHDCFKCQCDSCNASWGKKKCGNCGKSYPFLMVGVNLEDLEEHPVGWVDTEFGRDVLAVPCWVAPGRNHHICPHCGVCGNSTSSNSENCERCRQRNGTRTVHK